MTLLALVGASCLAVAIASGDPDKLDEAQTLRAESAGRLKSAVLSRERAASRLHDLEAIRAGQPIAPDRLADLRSVVLDVASPGTGFGVRWTHPLLELPEPSQASATGPVNRPRSTWHQIDPVHRGPVAAFGLTLIFASVLSGGGDRKIHASAPDLDDTLPQNCSHGESQMSATTILAPDHSRPSQEFEWMPTPVDALESPPFAAIDDEDEGDLFYFDDENDDQDEDEDDGFFFDDDDDDEDDEDDDDLESDKGVSPEDEDDDEDDDEHSGFGDDDDEEYEFED